MTWLTPERGRPQAKLKVNFNVKQGVAMNIGELAKQSGLAASRIRFYEAEGLISQVGRQANGYRRYAPEALQALQLIQSAQQAGFTLQELKALMPAPGEHKRDELIEALERKVAQIEGMQA
ncbi:hypothetical protein GCM10008969_42980 [Pseudomonas veronii subsp. inensis]